MAEIFPMIAALGAWNWLILAAILLALETALPGFFLLWFGLAALAIGIVAFTTPITWPWELLVFGLFSIAAVIISRRYFRPRDGDTDRPHLNRRLERYVGQTFRLAAPVSQGRSRIRIGDTMWTVEGLDLPDGAPEGTKIRITGTNGNALTARAA